MEIIRKVWHSPSRTWRDTKVSGPTIKELTNLFVEAIKLNASRGREMQKERMEGPKVFLDFYLSLLDLEGFDKLYLDEKSWPQFMDLVLDLYIFLADKLDAV